MRESYFCVCVSVDASYVQPKDEGDSSGMPMRPQIPEDHPDVHIIYDTEHVGEYDPVHLVRKLEKELDRHGYSYTDNPSHSNMSI